MLPTLPCKPLLSCVIALFAGPSVGHGEREPARQRQNHGGEDGATAAATRGGQ